MVHANTLGVFTEQDVGQLYEWFESLENRLTAVTQVAPLADRSFLESFSSPRLVPILVEACSIIDTMYRHSVPDPFELPGSGSKKRRWRASIGDYFRLYEASLCLGNTASMVYASPPFLLTPFASWDEAHPPVWWSAYNELKHDRLRNGGKATVWHTLTAVCALHQVMLKVADITKYSLRFGWIAAGGWNPEFTPDMLQGACGTPWVASTRYFATPFGATRWTSVNEIAPGSYQGSMKLLAWLGRYYPV